MQAFCGFSAVFLAFIIPYFDDFCTVYRMIGIVQFTLTTLKIFHNIIEVNLQCNPDRRIIKIVSIPVIAYN